MITDVPLESQAFDRYSYTSNNPLKYIDPTGHDHCGGVPGFSYCYYLDNTFITIEWQGTTLNFDLTQYDPQKDLKILNAMESFVEAADSFKIESENVSTALLLLFGALGSTALGVVTCPAIIGCVLAGISIAGVVGSAKYLIDSTNRQDDA